MIGSAVSHYRILEKLGEGGMGVVYKAEDTALKRPVAIKFLPRHVSAATEERERFKIEAQAAAALNHPNIATIYAIEEHDDETFIVMEFIEGRELRQIVGATGPVAPTDTVHYAIQIAEGLKAAHAKGIIHRDIKSSNIMVTASGHIKIMDFGLAKIGNVHLTKSGATVGTAAYMSPEQARGEDVDHRTDIWSLGVVLFEMLTGHLPFRGRHDAAMVYSILNEETEALTALRPDLPAALERMVEQALQKDRRSRYQRMEELITDMQRMQKELQVMPIPSGNEPERRKLAAIMFTDMVGYSALTQRNEALALELLQEQRQLLRSIFPKHAGREIESNGDAFFVEFTSALQGARCAIEIQKNLHERNASASEEKQINIRIGMHLGDVVHLGKHVHGDGVNIAARIEPLAESGGISISEDVARQIQNKIDLPLRKLGKSRLKNIQQAVQIYSIVLPWLKQPEAFTDRFYFALKRRRRFWFRLAAAIFAIATLLVAGPFWFLPKTGTAPDSSLPPLKTMRLTSFQGEEYDPVLSPDGNMIAFSWNGPKLDNFDIYIKLVDAGSPLRLTTDAAGDFRPAWSPDGRYIAFVRLSSSSRGLYVIPALGGTERKLAEANTLLESSMCWSADGASLLITDKDSTASSFNIFVISLETGEKRRLTTTPRDYTGDHTPRVSPNGQMLAFVRMKDFGIDDIYAVSLAGGEPRRITFDKTQITGMSWTADSREIVFTSNQNLWRVSISSGAPKRLDVGGENAGDPSLSLQRHRLAYLQITNNTNIWRIEIANPALPGPLISSTQENHFPHYSPDGKKIAFASNRSGSLEVWVCDNDGQNPVQLSFLGSGVTAAPRWSPDGKRIVFDSRSTGEAAAYIISADGGKPRRLTTSIPDQAFPSWSRDGRWVYFSSKYTGTYQVWKIPVEGDKAEQVTKAGGLRAFESFDGKFVYYFKNEGIWQVPVAGGEERPILEPLNAGSVYKWAVTEKGIYFINPQAKSHATIEFFNFSTKRVKRVAVIEKPPSWLSLAVSPDERWLLYAQLDHSDSDIMLVENFH